jgi:hypothetical protein
MLLVQENKHRISDAKYIAAVDCTDENYILN